MSIEVASLTELDPEAVSRSLETIISMIQEDNPAIDLKRGVFHDLVAYYAAILAGANQENIDRYRRSASIYAIEQDPSIADTDNVDRVMSNFGVTRKTGSTAVGSIAIVVSKLAPVSIQSGAVFVADGKQFLADTAYSARTSSANVQSSTDRVLTPLGDGSYVFTIDVTAADVGVGSMASKDAMFEPATTIVNFVKAYAASDFIGGVDDETNNDLLQRLQGGIAASALSNRTNMVSLLSDDPVFEDAVSSSIIGYGDAEMPRDSHSLFPISFGGRVDWYLRTQALPRRNGLTKSASLVTIENDNSSVWQFSLDRDDVPGFYDVMSITPLSPGNFAGSFKITQEIRGSDLTPIPGELLPDITTTDESAYSRYQSAVIQFRDTEKATAALTIGDIDDYTVTVRGMPLIAEFQTKIGSRDHRNYAGDALIKAPVPCFVSLSFVLNGSAGDRQADAFLIKEALAEHVNKLGFRGRLEASGLTEIIQGFLFGRTHVGEIDMFAQIRRPDGTVKPLRNTEVLAIPSEPDKMVTSRTVCFILEQENIAISSQTVAIPETV